MLVHKQYVNTFTTLPLTISEIGKLSLDFLFFFFFASLCNQSNKYMLKVSYRNTKKISEFSPKLMTLSNVLYIFLAFLLLTLSMYVFVVNASKML